MPGPSFVPKQDGIGQTIYADDINQLQNAVSALGQYNNDGDLLVGATDGTGYPPVTLPRGTTGQVLTVQSDGTLAWATPLSGGMSNPMAAIGDMIAGGVSGVQQRLPIGSSGQVLTVVSGAPTWANAASGFADPQTTTGDMIYRAAGGTTRLPIGSSGQVLTVSGGVPSWSSASLANPMTTAADLITGGASGAPARLGVGANGQVLTVVSGAVAWANAASGFTNPMTTKGDLIAAASGGTATRLGVGSNGTVLIADSTQTTGVKWTQYALNAPRIWKFLRSSTSGYTVTYSAHDTGAYATGPGLAGTVGGSGSGQFVSGVTYDCMVRALGVELDAPSDGFIYLGLGFGNTLSGEVQEGTPGGERTPGNAANFVITGDGTTSYTAGCTLRVDSGTTGAVDNGFCEVYCQPRS